MSPSRPPDRTRLVLASLACACVAVGLLWGLRWAFEGRVAAGHMSPDAAMDAMARFVALLYSLGAIVAAALAALLAWIAKRTRDTRLWPPSGSWPVPRPITDDEAKRFGRRLHGAAAVAGGVAVAALLAALT